MTLPREHFVQEIQISSKITKFFPLIKHTVLERNTVKKGYMYF